MASAGNQSRESTSTVRDRATIWRAKSSARFRRRRVGSSVQNRATIPPVGTRGDPRALRSRNRPRSKSPLDWIWARSTSSRRSQAWPRRSGRRASTFGKKVPSQRSPSTPIAVPSRSRPSVGICVGATQVNLSPMSRDSRGGSPWLLQEARSCSACSRSGSLGAGVSRRGSQRRRQARHPMEALPTAHRPWQEVPDPG
jgi:hypothetical protein